MQERGDSFICHESESYLRLQLFLGEKVLVQLSGRAELIQELSHCPELTLIVEQLTKSRLQHNMLEDLWKNLCFVGS